MSNEKIIMLSGRIDTNNAPEWEQRIMEQISPDTACAFDASGLEYISSAGLRVLMKAKKKLPGDVRIFDVSPEVYDILDMTGFTELLKVEKRLRELSVDGCEIIGKGFCGIVYRLDPETIVKVYQSPDSMPTILREQRLAKRAFVKGVPTAISYDIVKVGGLYGSVFEMLNAQSFNDHLIKSPECFDEILDQYVEFLKVVHSAEMDPDTIPMAKNTYLHYLEEIQSYLTDAQYSCLRGLLSAMPEDLHIIHGDFQMKNVMLVGDEPMLIDMETLATGQPIFDLAALYVTYSAFPEDDPENLRSFLGIPTEWGGRIWKQILNNYFKTADAETLSVISDKIALLGTILFLHMLASSDLKEGELGEKRIRRSQMHIADLTGRVQDLIL